MSLLTLLLALGLAGHDLVVDSASLSKSESDRSSLHSNHDNSNAQRPDLSTWEQGPHPQAALLEESDQSDETGDVVGCRSARWAGFLLPKDDHAPRWPRAGHRQRFSDRSTSLRC